MNVKPMLGDWEIPKIESIAALENRAFVELAVPGRAGSLFQDMHTIPARIAITGSLYGDDDRNQFVEQIRGMFHDGEPVTFVGDIVTATAVQYVIIEELQFIESGAQPDQVAYRIVLKESPPPPPPADALGGIDTSLLDEAGDFLDSVTGALDAIDMLSIPDISDPTPPLRGTLDGVASALEQVSGVSTALQALFGEEE